MQNHVTINDALLQIFPRSRYTKSAEEPEKRKCFDLLMAAGADVNKTTANGETALMYAAKSGYTMGVNALIDAGADVNVFDNEGFSPLMNAIFREHTEVIECLIKAGVEVNTASRRGGVPARYAHTTALSYKYPLLAAAFRDRQQSGKIIDILITAGADVNATDDGGTTALHDICFNYTFKKLRTVRSLIKAGADVNRMDNSGNTPLSHVRHADCACELLVAGAQINRTTPNALQRCITLHSSTEEVCMLLFAAGETINGTTVVCKDVYGEEQNVAVPNYLLFDDLKLNLKHLCREAIRKRLLYVDLHTHLFDRVPKLGLPFLLNEYLLYDVTCEPRDENDEEDQESNNERD